MAQFGFGNNGIRVRDPSQMFVFGDTNWVNRVADSHDHESAGLLTKNKSQQVGIFSKPFIVNQSSGSDTKNLPNKDDNMFTRTENSRNFQPIAVAEASSSDENQPCFGSSQTCQSQRPPVVNYFDPFRIPQQGRFRKPSQSPNPVNNQLSNVVSVKKEDGQRWSTGPANIRLGSHVQQNEQNTSVTGSCELPGTSYASNKRIRKRSTTRSLNSTKRNTRVTKRSDTQCSLNSKKRKLSTFELLPWHKEVAEGSSRVHDISTAEVEWARSVVRVPETLKELGKVTTYSCWIPNRKRRLSLTTHLMQMLFQPPPANVLADDAITHCDVVTYYGCKLALGGACSSCVSAGKNMASKSRSDQDLLKVIEGFMDRSKRLKDDLLRLEKKKSSIREVIVDFQDLERFLFLNRFAKFHTRKPTVTGDTSSSAMPKLYPLRDVKAVPMPKMVPEGQNCLLL